MEGGMAKKKKKNVAASLKKMAESVAVIVRKHDLKGIAKYLPVFSDNLLGEARENASGLISNEFGGDRFTDKISLLQVAAH